MGSFDLPADFLTQFRQMQQDVANLGTRVNRLGGQLAGRSLVGGTFSVTTTASATGTAQVSHGLGVVPAGAIATAGGNGGIVNAEIDTSTPADATHLTVRVGYTDGTARTFTSTVYWFAWA